MKIVAHRGYVGKYSENTLGALKEAIKKGATAVEFDIHFSLDKRCILYHDYSLVYPNRSEKLISELKSTDIRKISEQISILDEVLQEFGKSIQYEIELKGYTKEFINEMVRIVTTNDLFENIEFTSPHSYVLTYLKQLSPKIRTGMFVNPLPTWMNKDLGRKIIKNTAILGSINVAHIPIELLSVKFVEEMHNENILVHIPDCNTEKEMEKAYQLGADQFSTNMLNLALQIKNRYEK